MNCARRTSRSFRTRIPTQLGPLFVFAQLVPVEGGTPITIDRDVSIVGRQEEGCDIVIDRKSVSKMHCILVKTDGLLFIRDLFSTNGTKVNGQKITRGALLPGDTLSLAGEKFRVHLAGPVATVGGVTASVPDRTMELVTGSEEFQTLRGEAHEVDALPVGTGSNGSHGSGSSGAGMDFIALPPGGVKMQSGSHEDLVE